MVIGKITLRCPGSQKVKAISKDVKSLDLWPEYFYWAGHWTVGVESTKCPSTVPTTAPPAKHFCYVEISLQIFRLDIFSK